MRQITNLQANVGTHPPLTPPASGRGMFGERLPAGGRGIDGARPKLPSRLREGLGVGLSVWHLVELAHPATTRQQTAKSHSPSRKREGIGTRRCIAILGVAL